MAQRPTPSSRTVSIRFGGWPGARLGKLHSSTKLDAKYTEKKRGSSASVGGAAPKYIPPATRRYKKIKKENSLHITTISLENHMIAAARCLAPRRCTRLLAVELENAKHLALCSVNFPCIFDSFAWSVMLQKSQGSRMYSARLPSLEHLQLIWLHDYWNGCIITD